MVRAGVRYKSLLRRAAFFPAAIFYMELILRLWSNDGFWGIGLLYGALFSLGAGMVCNLLTSFWRQRVNRRVGWVLVTALTLLFAVQVVYYGIFRSYMELNATKMAGDVLANFAAEAVSGVGNRILPLLLLLFPLAVYQAFDVCRRRPVRHREAVGAGVLTVVIHVVAIGSILTSSTGLLPLSSIYRENFTLALAVNDFGLVTSTRLDWTYTLLGKPEPDLQSAAAVMAEHEPQETPQPEATPEPELVYPDNVLEIDFDALLAGETDDTIADMHQFFSSREPTAQNAYTGYFAGKNLIWLVGEAFSTMAIDEQLTPTLYQMSQEGFQFPNFYTPDTGYSTSGGEFETLLGLVPNSRDAFERTGALYMPFGFGNQLAAQGYKTMAYHNHTYTYYGRDKSHPNLGYTYKGYGNGLDVDYVWPESDVQMMELSLGEYIDAERFHAYYMTVSGHLEYNFFGNAMAMKNQEFVENLDYSDAAKAYLACHIELDRALEYLVTELEAAGKLEDTVFVLSGDHYPYGLTDIEVEELRGESLEDTAFDLYESTLILWSAGMEETVVVDSYCSMLDVMPTLANLFGLPYDSRLVMGVDLLSDAEPLVMFYSRSWISQYGRFSSRTGEFTCHPHVDEEDVPEGHAQQMQSRFILQEGYSEKILAYDYYRVLFGEELE